MCMNAAIDQPPGHHAETLRIEITKVDDVDRHVHIYHVAGRPGTPARPADLCNRKLPLTACFATQLPML